MTTDRHREYTNGEITVYWKPELCCHSTICIRRLPRVFNLSRRPWIDMQGADTHKIIEVVDQCPTDALSYSWNNPQ